MKNSINGVSVEVYAIHSEENNKFTCILSLKEKFGERIICMNIPYFEAQLIQSFLNNNSFPVEFVHDILLKNFNRNNQEIESFAIVGFSDGIFYGELNLKNGESYNCRPSDGLILAIKSGAEILIEQMILDEIGLDIEELMKITQNKQNEDSKKLQLKKKKKSTLSESTLDNYIRQKDFDGAELIKLELIGTLNEELDEAILIENYEKAADLRDKIKDLQKIKIK